nr:helix-turn-helix transcriptional regulator [Heyndrickxia oleronia]
MKKLKSNIGWLIDKSPYNREFIRQRYGKTATSVSSWCTGKSYPAAPILFDLAELLGVKVDDLYDKIDDNQ